MDKMTFAHINLVPADKKLENAITGQVHELNENQLQLLVSFFAEPETEFDFFDLASIGWPRTQVDNTEIVETLTALNESLLPSATIVVMTDNSAKLCQLPDPITAVQDNLQHESPQSMEQAPALDLKTLIAAVIIVAITAVILINS